MTRVVLLTAAAEDAFIGTSNKNNLQLEYSIGSLSSTLERELVVSSTNYREIPIDN
jgi:hypothetical protein